MILNLNLYPDTADGYKKMNGLSLAFVGDAVYELLVRQLLTAGAERSVRDLHADCVALVNADYQASAMERLLPVLTEEELTYFKRGRNAKSTHTPKNKTEAHYHMSTGFEALFGFVYLQGDRARLAELFKRAIPEEMRDLYEQAYEKT